MTLFERLKPVERDMIKCYIEDYAVSDNNKTTLKAGLNYILRHWMTNKAKLYRLLGENFIISKDVEFEVGYDELYTRIADSCFSNNTDDEMTLNSYKFYETWFDKFVWGTEGAMTKEIYGLRDQLASMLSIGNLVKNVWEYDSFTLTNPQNPEKPFKVSTGCKLTKMIGKIAAAYEIPYYEDFRIKHSQALNQKKLKGQLKLSIHPLDFMTMSDNESGWSSCMSWYENGCYRQGTVEMMNSPMVVVAYLESETDKMSLRTTSGNYRDWNSKKWRELFVINDDIITEVKSYPYRNEELTKAALNWLKELSIKLCDGHNNWVDEIHTYNACSSPFNADDEFIAEHGICVYPRTNQMYNDFASGELAYFAKWVTEQNRSEVEISFNYSGESECMICGASGKDYDWDCEGDVVCENCFGYTTCDCCGDRIYDDSDIYEVDGEMICRSCYEYNTRIGSLDGEIHMSGNVMPIYVIKTDENGFAMRGADGELQAYTRPLFVNDNDLDAMQNGDSDYIVGKLESVRVGHYWGRTVLYLLDTQFTDKAIDCLLEYDDNYHSDAADAFLEANKYENGIRYYMNDKVRKLSEVC